jgi:DNA-directed RNA polymerase subunit E'/Rpb7
MDTTVISHYVDLDPEDFYGDALQKAREKFIKETQGKCLKDHGEVTRVLGIISIEQKPLLPSGQARFQVTCKAEVFRVRVGDTVAGVVTHVDPLGTIAEGRSVSVCIPAHFDGGKRVPDVGDEVQVRILAVRFEGGRYNAIGNWIDDSDK